MNICNLLLNKSGKRQKLRLFKVEFALNIKHVLRGIFKAFIVIYFYHLYIASKILVSLPMHPIAF